MATFAGKVDNLPPASPTLCVAVDVSLKAHKPVEAAIFFSRVQKHTELWHHSGKNRQQHHTGRPLHCKLPFSYSTPVFTQYTVHCQWSVKYSIYNPGNLNWLLSPWTLISLKFSQAVFFFLWHPIHHLLFTSFHYSTILFCFLMATQFHQIENSGWHV